MIHVRSEADIKKIRSACAIAVSAMKTARDMMKPGIATIEIADNARKTIESHGAKAAFWGYRGFPGAICVSVNDEVVHGIPGSRILEEGDIVKVDIGTYIDGFYGDMTRTFPLGTVSEKVAELVESTEESLYIGIAQAVAGKRVGDIGHAVQEYVESKGYSVVRALVGHGIGRHLHEDPQVPNFGRPGTGALLKNGMVLAVEPMVNDGVWQVKTIDNGWTVVTEDGGMSAHFENTCVVRDGVPEILTLMDGEEKWLKTIQ